MSWASDVQESKQGLKFGGIPYDAVLSKLEETDPELVDEVRGFDEFHDLESDYNDYVRTEIVDWTPDAPFTEFDHQRRDPAVSRSILNLRYNGTRGSNPELPRHPELFIGFTGNDPRGMGNDPRFDEVRGHMTARAANLTVRMGDNDDHHIAERPWTNQSISYAMKEIDRRFKRNTKIFSVQKEGRPWSRNVVADQFAFADLRAAGMEAGDEGLAYRTASGPGSAAADPFGLSPQARERFAGGDHGPADEAAEGGVRGVDAARRASADRAPWRHATGEADLGVQEYGQSRGQGRALLGAGAVGGGRVRAAAAEQDWAEGRAGRGANRQTLAASMALAARHRRAATSGVPDQEPVAPGTAYEGRAGGAARLTPARDVAHVYRAVAEDQARRPRDEVQDDEGGALGASAGLTPARRPEAALRAAEAAVTGNAHLTNVGAIVAGLREGTASGRRRIAGAVVSDGARHLALSEGADGARKGALPGADLGAVQRLAEAPLANSAAAAGLAVHVYRGAPPRRERRAAAARAGDEAAAWRASREALPFGASKGFEWRSATQGQGVVGDEPDAVFGFDAGVGGPHGSAPVGPKGLRAGGWSDDSTGLTDEIGAFSDGIGASA